LELKTVTTIVPGYNTHTGVPIIAKDHESDLPHRRTLFYPHTVGPARCELEY
jgi:hypothetical protein